MIEYSVKEKLEKLDSKIEKVDSKVDKIKNNDIQHLCIDISNIKGQLIYMKWFMLAIMSVVISTAVKLWFV